MARFITTGDLSGNTAIQANVQVTLLEPFIDGVQQLYALRLLSISQYEALESAINTYTLTGITGYDLALINKLKPMLCWATLYEALPFLETKITNKGLVIKASEGQSSSAQDSQYLRLYNAASKWTEFYLQECKRYLRNNKNNYPLWREEYFTIYEANSGATYNNGTGYKSSIIFDRTPNRGINPLYEGFL